MMRPEKWESMHDIMQTVFGDDFITRREVVKKLMSLPYDVMPIDYHDRKIVIDRDKALALFKAPPTDPNQLTLF
jgi:hypothetical protein